MKIKTGSRSYSFGPLKLYREEIDEVLTLLKSSCESVELSDEKYTYDSLEEIENRAGKNIRYLEIFGIRPYIHVKLGAKRVYLKWAARMDYNFIFADDDNAEALFFKVREILSGHERILRRVVNWPLFLLLTVGGSSFTFSTLHIHSGTIAILRLPISILSNAYTCVFLLLHAPNESPLQFLFSHLFAFSFIPAFAAGLINYKYRHSGALFVWIVPSSILLYQFLSFPTSKLESHTAAAYHQYFAGGFIVPEYRDYREMFALAAKSSDMVRGIEQFRFTAPFYAGIAYSMASLFSKRMDTSIGSKKKWESPSSGHAESPSD